MGKWASGWGFPELPQALLAKFHRDTGSRGIAKRTIANNKYCVHQRTNLAKWQLFQAGQDGLLTAAINLGEWIGGVSPNSRVSSERRGDDLGGGKPGAAGVVTADQPFQSLGGGQPTGLHHQSLAVAHLGGTETVAPIRQQQ